MTGTFAHWPVALAIGGLSGFAAAILAIVDRPPPESIVWLLVILMLGAPVLAIGYLAMVLQDRWLRRTIVTVIIGGLLARLIFEVVDGVANGWTGRGYIAMCNASAIPPLFVFFAAVMLLAAGLRLLARNPAR
ncbi:MAG TPA: hypothetical protein VFH24_07355 [Gemmatimonadales bacterium]|nr:hypothetical protein [Gemmatimonadales bacterium]